MRTLLDPFLLALVGIISLAALWPEPGLSGGPLHFEYFTAYGVSIIFFLYGLTLAPEKMRAGLLNWRLHIAVQIGTFVIFPLLVLGAGMLGASRLPSAIWIGFFFIAALPSTVSSSVAMVSIARGNIPGAIFNASLSSLIGVVVTPLWMAWFLAKGGIDMAVGPVIIKILLLVVTPIIVGQVLHRPLARWTARHLGTIRLVDRVVIIGVVYGSTADSFATGVWSSHPPLFLVGIAAGAVALFTGAFATMGAMARVLGFGRDDRITMQFCASKKSMVMGVPMAGLIFGHGPQLGLIIAPLLLYHFFQLVIVSMVAGHERRTAGDAG